MKTIGLLGGMSWKSTITYYQLINELVNSQLGGLHSAKIVLYSVDFHEIEECQASGDWDKSAQILSDAAIALEKAGADVIVICANTMHKVAPDIKEKINVPILHIAEAIALELVENNIGTVALLGTKYTMQQDFYKSKLIEKGIDVIIPNEEDIEAINRIIYDELCLGVISSDSKQKYIEVIDRLAQRGAQGVILGCTEIGLLINQGDTELPLFDTTKVHATKVALFALEK